MKHKKLNGVKTKSPVASYEDSMAIVLAILIISGVMCFYGYQGEYMMEVLSFPFLAVYGLFCCISTLMLVYIARMVRYLDSKLPWTKKWATRLLNQMVWCLVLPLIVLFLQHLLFTLILPPEVRSTGFLHTDLVIHTLVLIVINMSYTLYYFVNLISALNRQRSQPSENGKEAAEISLAPVGESELLEPTQEMYVYTVNNTITKVSFDQVAFGYWTNKIGKIGKFGGEEVYITEQSTLKDMHAAFKGYCKMVNRNYIIPQNALARCIKHKDGCLLVLKEKTPTDITISKEKFQELREWILAVVDIEIGK